MLKEVADSLGDLVIVGCVVLLTLAPPDPAPAERLTLTERVAPAAQWLDGIIAAAGLPGSG